MIPTVCSAGLSPFSAALVTTAVHNNITGTASAPRDLVFSFIEPLSPGFPPLAGPAARAALSLSPAPRRSLPLASPLQRVRVPLSLWPLPLPPPPSLAPPATSLHAHPAASFSRSL